MTEKTLEKIVWTQKVVDLNTIKPNERNPRFITRQQYEKLKSSLEETGYHARLLVDRDLNLIGGHMRLKAMQELGFQEVTVLMPSRALTDEERQRVSVQDNVAFGEWDLDILAADFSLDDLHSWGIDESDLKFPLPEAAESAEDPEAIPVAPPQPITLSGDVWRLGAHRIMCGDSTDEASVSQLLSGDKPHLMVTDPPYGVNYDASWREGHDLNLGKKIGGKFSARSTGKVQNDHRADWTDAWLLSPATVAYVWHADKYSPSTARELEKAGFQMRNLIVWAKQHFVFGRGDYHHQHEPCWYAVKKGSKGQWAGDRKQSTLWEINNNNPFGTSGKAEKKEGHSTQKPVECMRRPIENNSKPGDSVYEPFSGSGSTIIAAEMSGRICLAMEINPAYCDMAILRWQNFTKKEAVHAKTGKTFNEAMAIKNAAMKAAG